MAELVISGEVRTRTGKGVARRARVAGKVPAVVYGPNQPANSLLVDARELVRAIQQGSEGRLVILNVSGNRQPVILKDVQVDSLKGTPLHADFHAVALDQVIQTSVPIVVTGEQVPGEEPRLVIHDAREITVECLPTAIPESIEVDLVDRAIGETLVASDLVLPAGVTLVSDPETVILSISVARAEEAEETEDEEITGEVEDAAETAVETE